MTTTTAAAVGSRAARRRQRLVGGMAGVAVLLVAVEVVSRAHLVDPAWMPPASTILATSARLLTDPAFLVHVGGTITAAIAGLAVATGVGVLGGVAIASSRRVGDASVAAIELLRPIPSVALVAPAILVLGRGLDMRIALVTYAATWPILVNVITGLRSVDPVARDTARAFGLSRSAVIRHVDLPSAAPFAATGVRISAGIAVIVAISAELVAGGPPGLGVWLLSTSQGGEPRELAYAGLVVAGLLGVTINALLAAGERRVARWHPRVRNGDV